jgi:hypothetical protein
MPPEKEEPIQRSATRAARQAQGRDNAGQEGDEGEVSKLAVVTAAVEAGASPTRVMYFEEDRTFLLLDPDAPEEPDERHDPEDLVVICAHCLLEHHPEAGRGMDLAQRSGAARYREGAWIAEGDWS